MGRRIRNNTNKSIRLFTFKAKHHIAIYFQRYDLSAFYVKLRGQSRPPGAKIHGNVTCESKVACKLFTLRDSADPVNKDRSIKQIRKDLTYRGCLRQGSAPGQGGRACCAEEELLPIKGAFGNSAGVFRNWGLDKLKSSYKNIRNINFWEIFVENTRKGSNMRHETPKIRKLRSKANKMEPKDTKSEPIGPQRSPKRTKNGANGSQAELKGSQM